MPDYGTAYVVFGVSCVLAWLFFRWADHQLAKTRLKEFPAFRHGGLQAQVALLCCVTAFMSLVMAMAWMSWNWLSAFCVAAGFGILVAVLVTALVRDIKRTGGQACQSGHGC